MPNWCENELVIHGKTHEDVQRVLRHIAGKDNTFDFEKVIPMPSNIYRGSLSYQERQRYARNNWYDWSVDHWGTKWNSSGAEVMDDTIMFYTAWTPCTPVIQRLAEIFHDTAFKYSYAEPDGNFSGFIHFKDGERIEEQQGCYGEFFGTPLEDDDDDSDEDTD